MFRTNGEDRRRTQVTLAVLLSVALCTPTQAGDNQPLVVHEWGTFTVLQDDAGDPVDGVNINEESLPPFVYQLAPDLAPDSHELSALIGLGYFQRRGSKGIRRYYQPARMRMETPIIYLYPPQDRPDQRVTVSVDFHGGWISEWYPQAEVVAPGYKKDRTRLSMDLTPSTVGSITWKDVRAANGTPVPQTDFPVWLAPRKTAAPTIRTPEGEAEKYLFYRGVANLEAPLRVTRDGNELSIAANPNSTCPIHDFGNLDLWLVDVGAEGQLQYRRVSVDQHQPGPGQALAATAATFEDAPGEGLSVLRQEMLAALIERGLFRDEAEAMLNTWEASYFRTSGLRLFFTLPQSWTDRVLPLQVSGYERTEVVRAMIGRIELISARQRELLAQISQGPASNRSWLANYRRPGTAADQARVQDLLAGRATLEDLELQPPADYQAYVELGRFRDALVLHKIANPAQRAAKPGQVKVNGTLIQIRDPADATGKVNYFTISLPGENRIINLGELVVYSGGQEITDQAKLSQSSNYEGRFPIENLVDGDPNCISHTKAETNPWIKVEFAEPVSIDEVKIWNRGDSGGRFKGRFDGAQVAFFEGEERVVSVEVRTTGSHNLRAFAHNYGLPGQ